VPGREGARGRRSDADAEHASAFAEGGAPMAGREPGARRWRREGKVMSTREFEFREGSSDKFWKITLDRKATTVTFGRRGTSGQTQTKKWSSEVEARNSRDKLIAEKTKKGYVESKAKANGTAKTNRTSKTPHPNPLPAARGEGTGAARGEGTGAARGEGTGAARGQGIRRAAEVVPPPAPAVVVSTSVERRIDLSPSDWAMATWRKRPAPKAAGKPAPFDREACAAKLLRLGWKRNGEQPDWSAVEIPAVMSREEAHYWFIALTSVR